MKQKKVQIAPNSWTKVGLFTKTESLCNDFSEIENKTEVLESKIHTAVHGLYFSKNQGMIGSRIFCDAICSIQIGHIFSTVWFNHRTDSESESTWR